jgi:carboxymethylenebutenolidase
MSSEVLEIPTADGPMSVCVAAPDGEPRGAIAVVPEAFGLNGHMEDVTGRCAVAGYVGVGMDIFHRAGVRRVAGYDDFASVPALFAGLNDAALLVDIDAVLTYLESRDISASRTGIVGFCFGGRVSFLAAARRKLGAAVSFYGGGIASQGFFKAFPALLDEVPALQTPWLGLFGDRDRSIPVDEVETLKAALVDTDVETALVRYPDADHGFHCDARPSYHAVSAADAWSRTIDWMGQHLA